MIKGTGAMNVVLDNYLKQTLKKRSKTKPKNTKNCWKHAEKKKINRKITETSVVAKKTLFTLDMIIDKYVYISHDTFASIIYIFS